MAFTVTEYRDLVRLLSEHPEWRAELRTLLFADDILDLTRIVRELAEAQQRTEARLEQLADAQQRTEARLEELAEAQQRTEARLEELAEAQQRTEARLEQLAEAQQRTEARLEQLAEAQQRTEARLEQLAEAQQRTEVALQELADAQKPLIRDVADLKGWQLEERYRKRAYAYFGRWMRKIRVVDLAELTAVEEARDRGELSDDEWSQLAALDVLVRGVVGKGAEAQDVLLALEVSWGIGGEDVTRARDRAGLLRRLGYPALGAVGGDSISTQAAEQAERLGVIVALDGRILYWPASASAGTQH